MVMHIDGALSRSVSRAITDSRMGTILVKLATREPYKCAFAVPSSLSGTAFEHHATHTLSRVCWTRCHRTLGCPRC